MLREKPYEAYHKIKDILSNMKRLWQAARALINMLRCSNTHIDMA